VRDLGIEALLCLIEQGVCDANASHQQFYADLDALYRTHSESIPAKAEPLIQKAREKEHAELSKIAKANEKSEVRDKKADQKRKVDESEVATGAKKPRNRKVLQCANNACMSRQDDADEIGWLKCTKKKCNLFFCPSTECQNMRTKHAERCQK
jgi:hypothetical protein